MDYVKYIRSLVGNKKIIMTAGAVIIYNDKDEILLQHRGDDHFWGLPGGIMEIGEKPNETAIREAFEETGYNIEITDYLGDYHNFNKSWPGGDEAHIICFIYQGVIISGEMVIDGKETLDLKWFNMHDLPNIDAIDHVKAISDYYNKK
ncbi:Diadenosine hexaphosphate hydrolase [Candidatus Izimaplasma bacterium HR1]|jgi:8-oxo-dGTP pyrophosphatase MutT (NUDIX family)|uniref:NUDIX domain-containing protein n=1 Tax=Candidatus Izimoplasma sp. HR1 TaxID=1541959 RepID=UPI0004F7880C|nr:Diadenosine hexaphosphate hydrolase [Candidatus Izimaplasma bacterium HR1]